MLKEEATDVFIFLLKLMKTLDMNIEELFYRKMDKNNERFRSFEK